MEELYEQEKNRHVKGNEGSTSIFTTISEFLSRIFSANIIIPSSERISRIPKNINNRGQ